MGITLKKSKKSSEDQSVAFIEKFVSPKVVLESFPDIILIVDKKNIGDFNTKINKENCKINGEKS